ncbi:MAG: hypothetical protein Q7S92_05035 [Candidatus Diapherotrites archaeon]|nr:hypothetical protein [Candidatus Diapherotrites archaeon]
MKLPALFFAAIFFLTIFSINVFAIWPWDECANPSGGTFTAPGSATQNVHWFYDSDDWASAYIPSSGNYVFYLSGPSGQDFDLQLYYSCGGSPFRSSAGSTATESITNYISGGTTVHMRVIAFGSSSGNWTMGAYKSCTANTNWWCSSGDVYWYDSCGTRGSLKQDCTASQTCSVDVCVNTCTSHTSSSCSNGDVYWYNSCGTREDLRQDCSSSQICSGNTCQNVACFNDSQCPSDTFVSNTQRCSASSDVEAVWRNYSCVNPGTTSSSCSYGEAYQLYDNCTSTEYCNSSTKTCQSFACTSNSSCGTNAYTGSTFCSNNDVYKNNVTYTCSNPNTSSSSCSNSTQAILQQDCGNNSTTTSNRRCSGSEILVDQTATLRGCSTGACYSSTGSITTTTETDCSNLNYYGSTEYYCSSDNTQKRSRQLYTGFYCNSSTISCAQGSSSYVNDQLLETCVYGCSSGSCITARPNLVISSSDITIEKT